MVSPMERKSAMVIHEMTSQECRQMLARTNLARLACARNNQPYVVPVHVDLEGGFLYGYATMGQKIEWMRENPLVCLEMDELTSREQWATLIVFGKYEELPQTSGHQAARNIAEKLFQQHPMWWEPASVPVVSTKPRTPIVFRIAVDKVTGRYARQANPALPVREDAQPAKRSNWLARLLRRSD
jgi:nitroimidazol reductase NimA-like FMN-containing flavoprotein (pyridoxamine 5'-phosphate oxidase superfamily)